MLLCAPTYGSIKFTEQCLHIHTQKSSLNGFKGYNKIKTVHLNQNMTPVFTTLKVVIILNTEELK